MIKYFQVLKGGKTKAFLSFFLVLPFFLSNFQLLEAAEVINVSDNKLGYKLGLYLDILEDQGGQLTIDDIRLDKEHQFVQSADIIPNLGFTSSAYWVRFTLKSSLSEPILYFLKIGYPLLDKIDIYIPDEGEGFLVLHAGDHYPFYQRAIKNSDFIFELKLPPGKTQTYYARFETSSAMNLPLELWSPSALTEHMSIEKMILGIFIGVLLAMMIHNFFVYIITRDPAYSFYIIFVACNILFQFTLIGLTFQFLWPNQVWWANNCLPLTIFACYFAAVAFTRNVLNSKEHTPSLDKLLLRLNYFAGAGLFCSLFLDYAISIKLATSLVLTVPVFSLIGLRCWYIGYRPAVYYCIAWGGYLTGIFIFALKSFGVLPHNFFTHWGIQFGSALELILFSVSLADRYHIMKKEKERIQQDHSLTLETKNLELTAFNTKLDSLNQQLHSTIDELSKEINVRKGIEINLKESERTARVLIDTPFNLAALLEVDGTVIDVNKTLADYLGKQPKEIVGTKYSDYFSDQKIVEQRSAYLQEAVKSGGVVHFEDSWGNMFFDNVYAPVLDENQKVMLVTMISMDISRRVKAEKTRQEMEMKAISQAKLASLGQIATGIAHEINQPLSYIKIIFQSTIKDIHNHCLEIKELEEDAQESLRQVDRITTIISHLRTFGRADSDQFEPVSIVTIFNYSMILMRERLKLANIQLETQFAENLPEISGNKVKLEQVFINMLQNSMDAIKEKGETGKIAITISSSDDRIIVDFSDSGIGLKNGGANIFEPFYTTKKPEEGTGLGLSISYGIIKEHNGSIFSVESKLGGASFVLTFPGIVG